MAKMNRISCILLGISLLFGGCSKYVVNNIPRYRAARNYEATFESTWMAVNKALSGHTVVTAEKDSGVIVTGWAKGSSPLFIRKSHVSLFGGTREWGMGAVVADIMPYTVFVLEVEEDGPASKGGLKKLDLIREVNGATLTRSVDFARLLEKRPSQLVLKVKRDQVKEPLTVKIMPKFLSSSYDYFPVLTKYRLNVFVAKVGPRETEVKIQTEEEGILGVQTRRGWNADYAKMERSAFREKVILDRVGDILSQ